MQNPGVLAENVRSFKRRGRSEADAVRDALMVGQAEGGLPGEGGASGEAMSGGVLPGLMGGNTGITGGAKIPLPSNPGPRIKMPGMRGDTGPLISPPPDMAGGPTDAPLGTGAAASPDALPMQPAMTQAAPTATVGAPNAPFVPGGGGMEEMLLRRQLGQPGVMQAR